MVGVQAPVSYPCLYPSLPVECVEIRARELCAEVSTWEGLTGRWTIKSHKHLSPVSFAWGKKMKLAIIFATIVPVATSHPNQSFYFGPSDCRCPLQRRKGVGSSDSDIFKSILCVTKQKANTDAGQAACCTLMNLGAQIPALHKKTCILHVAIRELQRKQSQEDPNSLLSSMLAKKI